MLTVERAILESAGFVCLVLKPSAGNGRCNTGHGANDLAIAADECRGSSSDHTRRTFAIDDTEMGIKIRFEK